MRLEQGDVVVSGRLGLFKVTYLEISVILLLNIIVHMCTMDQP